VAEGGSEGQATGARTGTPDVFLSYASPNSAVAEAACEALERTGVMCWIAPRDVTPGASYAGQIIHAIDAAKAIVLILSENAASSPHVLREVERAASKRHPIISLRLDQAPLPADFEYFLNTSHWLDASTSDTARVMPKLVSAVRLAIQAPVVTPEAAQTPRSPAPSPSARPPQRTAIIVASLIGLAIAGFAVDRLWVSSRRAPPISVPTAVVPAPAPASAVPTIPEKSVAVLPFVDMSEKKDQEYFSDGMAEEILDLLTRVPGLTVIGRTSSFQFKGKNEDLRTIGAKLSVAYVLEGSVRRSAKQVRVTAQLIDTRTGANRWSQTYDRDAADVFKLQDEIATAVTQALRVVLSSPLPSRASTNSSEAYRMYLEGHFLGRGSNKAASDQAISAYRNALALDSSYAAAWAALAGELAIQANIYGQDRNAMYATAREAAQRAIHLDPGMIDGYLAMFTINYGFDWDWSSAGQALESARQIEPDNSSVLSSMGSLAWTLGQRDRAIAFARQAVARDPLSSSLHGKLGDALYCAEHYDEADGEYRTAIQLDPEDRGSRALLARNLMQQGRLAEAASVAQREPSRRYRLWALAMIYYAMGRRTDADAAFEEHNKLNPGGNEDGVAWIYSYRGELDAAFEWFDQAYSRRAFFLIAAKCMPEAPAFTRDPRYKSLLRKMNLPE